MNWYLGFPNLFFLYFYIAAVLLVLVFATAMERNAIKDGISGANGFIWTMFSMMLAVALLPVSLFAWLFGSFKIALITLVVGAIFLALIVVVTFKIMVSTKARKQT